MNDIEHHQGFIGVDARGLIPPGGQTLPTENPHEPPIFSVVKFRVRHQPGSGRYYDYAAIHAGDGKWYLTGGETQQGVSWEAMCHAIKPRLVGPIVVMAERVGFTL